MLSRVSPLDLPTAKPHLPAFGEPYVDRIDLRIAPHDGMETDDTHYLQVGASALAVVIAALTLAGAGDPGRILDFGSGAGRVTRWLRAAYPEAAIACCDLRPQDVDFCRDAFGAEAWLSSTDVEACAFRGPHDLIWMGSVLTHLSEAKTRRLVDRAMEALTPGGTLVATTMGRAGRAAQDRDGAYLQGPNWPAVKREHDDLGYGYTDYEAYEGFGTGYGLSLSSPAWATRLATAAPGRRLVLMSEGAWDGTQDVVALKRDPAYAADPVVPGRHQRDADALRTRVALLEGSTSWRLTAPLRRMAAALKARRGA